MSVQPVEAKGAGDPVPRNAEGIAAALSGARRMEFYRELLAAAPQDAEAVLRHWWCEAMLDIDRLLKESIRYGLEHRQEALNYAARYGRDLDPARADKFVGMYVNDWTLDFGPRGRQAVRELLARGHAAGVIPKLVVPEFIDEM